MMTRRDVLKTLAFAPILLTLVKLGEVGGRDNRFEGLPAGNHVLHFQYLTPKTNATPMVVTVDALGTAGNNSPATEHYQSVLTLE